MVWSSAETSGLQDQVEVLTGLQEAYRETLLEYLSEFEGPEAC